MGVIIVLDCGLLPIWHQAIILTNYDFSYTRPCIMNDMPQKRCQYSIASYKYPPPKKKKKKKS